MRLKSPFNDYYDGCLALDGEAEPLYVRQTKVTTIASYGLVGQWNPRLSITPMVVGFGRQVRACLKVYKEVDEKPIFCYDIGQFRKYVARHLGKKALADLTERTRRRYRNYWGRGWFESNIALHFGGAHKNLSTAAMPIWVVEPAGWNKSKLYANPRLVSIGFASELPPYQAYQELRMLLCAQAAPREYIPPISNNDMIEAKGFDLKTSFRSVAPGGPARKRRKRERKKKNNQSGDTK